MADIPEQGGAVAEPVAVAEPAVAADKPKAVFVENLSPNVTSKILNDFFSLCGTIESITLRPKANADDGTLEAIVSFESSGAAETAVLLTNAILIDRTINISFYNGSLEAEDAGAAAAGGEGGNGGSSGGSQSVLASLIAASYKFGDDVRARATEVDTKYGVSKGFEDTVTKIDQTLGLRTKINAMSDAVQQKSEQLGVNQKMSEIGASISAAGQRIGNTASAVFDSAMQNTYVNSAWTTLSGWGTSLINGWTQITSEADEIYTRQTGRHRHPPAVPADEPAAAAAAAPADGDLLDGAAPAPAAPVDAAAAAPVDDGADTVQFDPVDEIPSAPSN